jgi:hypothetical protein
VSWQFYTKRVDDSDDTYLTTLQRAVYLATRNVFHGICFNVCVLNDVNLFRYIVVYLSENIRCDFYNPKYLCFINWSKIKLSNNFEKYKKPEHKRECQHFRAQVLKHTICTRVFFSNLHNMIYGMNKWQRGIEIILC